MGKDGHQGEYSLCQEPLQDYYGSCLCKMDNLGEKIKLLKACEKRLLNHIIFDLYKKRMEQTANI